ncbi:MAG: hypothetical protein CMO30_00245 [Tistrella sp.]|jgi:hypothetical protein|uniref:CopG family ribbon-helix-helix protein n=1 Tax=Tistrella TaxID=171436 RepID=UPI000C590F41|nr:hypothetical protein [Tistrella sp.]MBA73713.1 hypothetical protein [Tistrella sp.]
MAQNQLALRQQAHRDRQAAAGRGLLHTYVPGELLSELDRLKEREGMPNRSVLVAQALKEFIERRQAEK